MKKTHDLGSKTTDMKTQIEIKFNTVMCWENCPLCSRSFKPDMMCAWPFLQGSWQPICEICAAKYDLHYPYLGPDAPVIVKMREKR